MKKLIIGTRGSKLARTQSEWVAERLRAANPNLTIETKVIRTSGDRNQSAPLPAIGGKGLFTQELDHGILQGTIDCAVHSMKDLPTEMTPGISILAVPQREVPNDALLSRADVPFEELPSGAKVGSGSVRRISQLKRLRSDLDFVDIRGNVDTRIRKLDEGQYDAIILAAAGLRRLGMAERISELFEPEVLLPAVGQGALAVTGRTDDQQIREALQPLLHHEASWATSAERAFLGALGGGCHVPIAAYGCIDGANLHLRGLVARPDGTEIIRDEISGPKDQHETLGRQLAERLLGRGARTILDALKSE